MEYPRKAAEFLDRHGIVTSLTDLPGWLQGCLEEMERGARGEKSCLAMIPTYLPEGADPYASEEPVIVIDVGGTNTRVALAWGDPAEKQFRFTDFSRYRTPGIDGPISLSEFYGALAEDILPVAGRAERIAVCFSFATRPTRDYDAVSAAGGKQLQVEGLIGSTVGENLIRELRRRGDVRPHRLIVINDTVASYLSARASDPDGAYDGYLGLVLGTGLNLCHPEPDPERGGGAIMVVNQECGGYLCFPMGDLDEAFIQATIDPDIDWCEKMISGRYFGELAGEILRAAVAEGTLSACPEALLPDRQIDSVTVAGMLSDPASIGAAAPEDRDIAIAIIDAVEERAALYTAVCLSSSLLRSDIGRTAPALISADGSIFAKLPGMRRKLCRHMDAIAVDLCGRQYAFRQAENAAMVGTAYAGLLL